MNTLYDIGSRINDCRTSGFGGADMEGYLKLEDVEFLYQEVLAMREALRKIRACFRAAEEFGFPVNGWKVGNDMAEIAEKMLGYPVYAAPWPAPSNNGLHADRASGPDNSEHSPETRPAGEP